MGNEGSRHQITGGDSWRKEWGGKDERHKDGDQDWFQ